ncbi:MAG: hypothetical protein VX228_02230 [Pseudomonadota bacterium]|nr:hypothetical protein [Pseudomonadota bacterium]
MAAYELVSCGHTGLVQLRLLLTQHSFALAAGDVPRCSAIFNAVIQMHSVKKRNHSIAAVVTAGWFISEAAMCEDFGSNFGSVGGLGTCSRMA